MLIYANICTLLIFSDSLTQWTVLGLSLSWEEQIWCLHSDLIGLGSV